MQLQRKRKGNGILSQGGKRESHFSLHKNRGRRSAFLIFAKLIRKEEGKTHRILDWGEGIMNSC